MNRLNLDPSKTSFKSGSDKDSGATTPTEPEPDTALALLQRHEVPIPIGRTDVTECVLRFIDGLPLTESQCQGLQRHLDQAGCAHDIALLLGLQAREPRFIPRLNLMAAAPPDTPSHQKNDCTIALLERAQVSGLVFAVQVGPKLPLDVARALAAVMALPDSGVTVFLYPSPLTPPSRDVFEWLKKGIEGSRRLRKVDAQLGVLPLFTLHGVDSMELRMLHSLPADQELLRVLSLGGTRHIRFSSEHILWLNALITQLHQANLKLPSSWRVQSLDLRTYSSQLFVFDPRPPYPDQLRAMVHTLLCTPGLTHIRLPNPHWLSVLDVRTLVELLRTNDLLHLDFAEPVKPVSLSLLDCIEAVLRPKRQRVRRYQETLLCELAPSVWSALTGQFLDSPTASAHLKSGINAEAEWMKEPLKAMAPGPTASALACISQSTAAAAETARKRFKHKQPAPPKAKGTVTMDQGCSVQ